MSAMVDKEGYILFTNSQIDWLIKQTGQLSKRENAALLAVIRFTHGFHRNKARMSASFISKATSIRASHIPETLAKLVDRGLIEVIPGSNKQTNIICFSFSKAMVPSPKTGEGVLPIREINISQFGRSTSPESGEKTLQRTIQQYSTEEDMPEDEISDVLDGLF